jgi:putative AdoMet-dependent methyltransferase
MARTEEQTRTLFEAWASSYNVDTQQEVGPLSGYAQSLDAAERLLTVPDNAHILDIGIGNGALASRFASKAAKITGIDLSEAMLDLARQKHPEFELQVGTFNYIPFPNRHFDVVMSSFAFHEVHYEKRNSAHVQMARVLKPNGILCLLDVMFVSLAAREAAREMVGAAWDNEEDYLYVAQLDTQLRQANFVTLQWTQTAPFHWMVIARKGSEENAE